jgi:hypothetical protein
VVRIGCEDDGSESYAIRIERGRRAVNDIPTEVTLVASSHGNATSGGETLACRFCSKSQARSDIPPVFLG